MDDRCAQGNKHGSYVFVDSNQVTGGRNTRGKHPLAPAAATFSRTLPLSSPKCLSPTPPGTAAWIMRQDRGYRPFHAALRKLIHHPEAMLRRNPALGLAAFGGGAARAEPVGHAAAFSGAARPCRG